MSVLVHELRSDELRNIVTYHLSEPDDCIPYPLFTRLIDLTPNLFVII